MPQQSQVFSRDVTIWNKEPSSTIGRQGKRNIISTKPGTKRLIIARVNDEKDVFQELWEHQNLCILRGVLKGRNEPIFSFWNEEYGRLIFRKTLSKNKFKSILRNICFLMIRTHEDCNDRLTSLLL